MILKILAQSEKLVRESARFVRGLSLKEIASPEDEKWFEVTSDLSPDAVIFHIRRHSGFVWMECTNTPA